QGRRPAEARRRPLRRRAQPRASREAAPQRRQRPPARRADQRSRRRHAPRARGGAARVRGLRGRDHARPLVPRPSGDARSRLRRRQPDDVVRGNLGRVRRLGEGDARRGRAGAAPHQVQAARTVVTHLLAFVAISTVVICTPGPDTALIVRNALFGGRANGVRTAAGIVTGIATWTLAASAGVAAAVAASHPLFTAIRIGGAAYLVWLGIQSFRGHARGEILHRPGSGYRQGLLSNLGNPKIAIFFTSLLPQFATGFGAL